MEVVHARALEGRNGAGRPPYVHPPAACSGAGAAAELGDPASRRKPLRMRIAVVAVGTRGDVEPHAALCIGLRQAGYDARLCAPDDFGASFADRGIPFDRIPVSFRGLYETAAGRALLATGASGIQFLRGLSRVAVD